MSVVYLLTGVEIRYADRVREIVLIHVYHHLTDSSPSQAWFTETIRTPRAELQSIIRTVKDINCTVKNINSF